MPRYNLPRQSFRHRFFTRNLASRERAGFEGFARSQGLEREKVNHDLTRSPVVARSPRPSLPTSLPPCFPPFPFHILATILVHFLWIGPVSFFRSDSSSRRDQETFAKTTITNGRTNREKEFIPPRRQVALRIFLSIVSISTAVGYSVLCSGVLPFSLSPFPPFAGFLLYAARADIPRTSNARISYVTCDRSEYRFEFTRLENSSRRPYRRALHTRVRISIAPGRRLKFLPSIFYPATFFTRYRVRLVQNSRDRIKFNDRC